MGAVSSNPEPRVQQSTCPETFPRAGAQLLGLAPDCVERPHLLSPKRKVVPLVGKTFTFGLRVCARCPVESVRMECGGSTAR